MFLAVFIIPSIVFASWWNPLTWFSKTVPTTVQPINTQNLSPQELQDLNNTYLHQNTNSIISQKSISITDSNTTKTTSAKNNNQICANDYGVGSIWTKKLNSQGGPICDCQVYFMWNTSHTSCVVVPIKTSDQICQDSYGINSNWSGTKNDKEGLNCSCKTGYEWNSNKTSCMAIPPVTSEQITRLTFLCNFLEKQNSLSDTAKACTSGSMLNYYNSSLSFRLKMDSLAQTLQQKQQGVYNNYLNTQQQLFQQDQTTYKLQQLQNSIDANTRAIEQQKRDQQSAQLQQYWQAEQLKEEQQLKQQQQQYYQMQLNSGCRVTGSCPHY